MTTRDSSTDSTEAAGSSLLTDIESVMEQQEAALLDLERLLMEERSALVNAGPRSVLETLQRVEIALGRIGQLESGRARLSARLAASVGDNPGLSFGLVGGGFDPSAPARLMDFRHRILGEIARVAEMNEANGQLVAGLARVSGAAIERLTQLQETDCSGPAPDVRDTSAGRWRPALEFRA